MTDDSPPGGEPISVDLLVIGGMTVDRFPDSRQAPGGAARYATEAALAAGLRVALHTVAGDEPVVSRALERLAALATVLCHPAAGSIHFDHHGTDDQRRLRLMGLTESLRVPEPDRLPVARAVLFAPVAGEVAIEALRGARARFRAAGIQGWLRDVDPDGWVTVRPPAALEPPLIRALRELDLLLASERDLGASDGATALAELRAWAGPGPELVVTAGAHGAWLDDGRGTTSQVPAQVVEGRHTIGAGDAFAAVLVARRGAGIDLRDAAHDAASATARYLATRPGEGDAG